MTACALMSLMEAGPLLMSDTVISQGNQSSIGPGLIIHEDFRTVKKIHLARKSYILNDKCAVAFAGDAEVIAEFLSDAKIDINFQENSPAPIRTLRDRASQRTKGPIYVIGAYVTETGRNLVGPSSILSQGDTEDDVILTIGSGGEDLYRLIEQSTSGSSAEKEYVPYFASMTINMLQMAEEIWQKKTNDWGGFFETLYYDGAQKRWVRQQNTAYVFYEIFFDENYGETFTHADPVVLYDSAGKIGRILSISGRKGFAAHYDLQDIMDAELNSDPYDHKSFWKEWNAETVCVTVAYGIIGDSKYAYHNMATALIPAKNLDKASISFDGSNFNFDVSGKALEDFFNGCREAHHKFMAER